MTAKLWYLSISLHRRGLRIPARIVKLAIYLFNQAVLPSEAVVGRNLILGHLGGGITVHPNVVIGDNVKLWHRVTLAVSDSPSSDSRIHIGNDVTIGSGAIVVSPFEKSLSVGDGAVIGANAVVTRDVPPGAVMLGNPARVHHYVGEGSSTKYR